MAIQRSLTRRIATVAYSANNVVPNQLLVTGKIRSLTLQLSGTLNVTGGGGTAISQNPGTLVPSITLRYNEQSILKQGRWIDWVDRGYTFLKLPNQTAAAAGVASYAIESTIELSFITPGGAKPDDTILVIGDNDRLDLDVQWTDENSLLSGGTKAWTTNPSINVVADMINDPNVQPIAVYKEGAFEVGSLGTAANTNFQGLQPTTGPALNYHHLIVVTEDNAATSLRAKVSNVNQIELQQSGQGIQTTPFGQISGNVMLERFNLNGWQQKPRIDATRAGVYPVLFQPHYAGRLTYNLNTADLDDLRFIINQAAFATDGVDRVVWGTVEPLAA